MALTRTALREKGITEKEILDYIMEEHGNVIEATKEKLKETADKTAEKLQKTIDTLQEKIDNTPAPQDGDDWKIKHDTLKEKYNNDIKAKEKEFNDFKSVVETEKTLTAKRTLAETKLAEAKALPSAIKFLVKEVPLDKLKDDGSNWDELHKPIMEANGDFYGKTETRGAGVATPPTTQVNSKKEHKDMNAFIRGTIE